MGRIVPRGEDLKNAQAVLAIGDQGEGAASDHSDFDVVDVVELASGGEELIELGRCGRFHIDDSDALLPCGDVGIGARDINVASIGERHEGVGYEFWMCEVGDVENLHSLSIDEECITELDGDGAWIVQFRAGDRGGNLGSERIVEVDDDEGLIGKNVSKCSGDGDAASAGEGPFWIEGQGTGQKIVCGIAVEERSDAQTFRLQIAIANDDEAFFLISDIEEAEEEVDGLFFVFGNAGAQGIYAQSCGRSNRDRVFRRQIETLAKRGNRGGGHALREAFVVDVGNVVDAKTAFAGGCVGIFAAGLHVEYVAFVAGGRGELAIVRDKILEVVGIRDALQVAAVDGFRFVVLGDGDGFEAFVAGCDIDVPADEVHKIRTLEQQLRHPGVVVVCGGNVTVGTLLGFASTNGVRYKGAEGLTGKPFGGNGLLLVVEPFAVRILRADQHGTR